MKLISWKDKWLIYICFKGPFLFKYHEGYSGGFQPIAQFLNSDGDTMCGQLIRSREAIVLLWQRRTQTTICLHNFRTLHLMFLLSVAFIERSGQIVTVCCANLRSALLFSPKYVSNKFYPIYRPIVHQHCKEVAYVWAGQMKWADSHGQCLESILFNPCIVCRLPTYMRSRKPD